ncbi:hypothetical protein [Shimazuella alba]|uniref:Uncharacterized protein n=1 Tax=Shimazuella alba TaxID=2690964 RepID=A0A6I4VUU6_9BACL|nr:hypothetical protein [Shimazuella alba]MXQ53660.1 hypothetical protein [Shimazuella alba]
MGIHAVSVGKRQSCSARVVVAKGGLITKLEVTSHADNCGCSKSTVLPELIKEYGGQLFLGITGCGDLKYKGRLGMKRLVPC